VLKSIIGAICIWQRLSVIAVPLPSGICRLERSRFMGGSSATEF